MIRKLARPVLLAVLGLAFLAAACWVIAVPLGLAATGAAFLLLEWRLEK